MKFNQDKIYSLARGQAQPHVYKSDLENLKIPIPPIEIQKEIVEKIENLEQKEKENQKKIEELKRKIEEKISQVDGELRRLGEIAEIQKGETITKKDVVEGNIPVVAGGKEPAYYHNKANREPDIITVSASGASAGYVNYWDIPIFASDCITIKAKENEAITKYIYYVLKFNQDKIYSLARGQAQPHVYKSDLENLKILSLPLEVQEKIVKEIEELENEIKRLQEEKQKTEEEKQTILNEYLS